MSTLGSSPFGYQVVRRAGPWHFDRDRQRGCPSRDGTSGWRTLVLLAAVLLLSSGCSGCRRDRKQDEKADSQAEELRKPDFQSNDLRVLPSDDMLAVQAVKPGHWISVRQELKSNRSDFYGELDSRSGYQSRRPMPLRQSSIELCKHAAPYRFPRDRPRRSS